MHANTIIFTRDGFRPVFTFSGKFDLNGVLHAKFMPFNEPEAMIHGRDLYSQ